MDESFRQSERFDKEAERMEMEFEQSLRDARKSIMEIHQAERNEGLSRREKMIEKERDHLKAEMIKNNVDNFIFLDLVAMSSPIGIFLGRISNFINSELYGRETDVIWSVKFIVVDNLSRHPSQIYEALFEGIIIFVLLNFVFKKLLFRSGVISSLFLIFYSIFRFFIEFTREPDFQLGYLFLKLTMGQIISVVFLTFGLILFYPKNETKK